MNRNKSVFSTSQKHTPSKKSSNISNLDEIIYKLLKIRNEIKVQKPVYYKFGNLISEYSYCCHMIKITKKKDMTIIDFYYNSKSINYHHTLSHKPNEEGFNYHSTVIDHRAKKHKHSYLFKLKFKNLDKYMKTMVLDSSYISYNEIKNNFHVFNNPRTNSNDFPLAEFIDLLLCRKPISHHKYKNSKKIFVVIKKDYKKFGYIKSINTKKNYNIFNIMMFEDALFVGSKFTKFDFIKNINRELEKNKTFSC